MDLVQKPIHPGEVLDEVYIKSLLPAVTVHDLAQSIDIPYKELTNFIAGKRPVTEGLAAKLAMKFRTTSGYWLDLQDLYNKRSQRFNSLKMHRQAKSPRR